MSAFALLIPPAAFTSHLHSPVITSTVTDTDMIAGIKHSLLSTGPAYIISLVFFFIYGSRYSTNGTVDGDVYNDIMRTDLHTPISCILRSLFSSILKRMGE